MFLCRTSFVLLLIGAIPLDLAWGQDSTFEDYPREGCSTTIEVGEDHPDYRLSDVGFLEGTYPAGPATGLQWERFGGIFIGGTLKIDAPQASCIFDNRKVMVEDPRKKNILSDENNPAACHPFLVRVNVNILSDPNYMHYPSEYEVLMDIKSNDSEEISSRRRYVVSCE